MNALGLTLQAQNIFIFRNTVALECSTKDLSDRVCESNTDGTFTLRFMTQADGREDAVCF
jgi:hypothetical protein